MILSHLLVVSSSSTKALVAGTFPASASLLKFGAPICTIFVLQNLASVVFLPMSCIAKWTQTAGRSI